MMNYMKGLEGCSFDQIITEVKFESTPYGDYYTAYVVVALGSYMAGKDKFMGTGTSRRKHQAIAFAFEEIAKKIHETDPSSRR